MSEPVTCNGCGAVMRWLPVGCWWCVHCDRADSKAAPPPHVELERAGADRLPGVDEEG